MCIFKKYFYKYVTVASMNYVVVWGLNRVFPNTFLQAVEFDFHSSLYFLLSP